MTIGDLVENGLIVGGGVLAWMIASEPTGITPHLYQGMTLFGQTVAVPSQIDWERDAKGIVLISGALLMALRECARAVIAIAGNWKESDIGKRIKAEEIAREANEGREALRVQMNEIAKQSSDERAVLMKRISEMGDGQATLLQRVTDQAKMIQELTQIKGVTVELNSSNGHSTATITTPAIGALGGPVPEQTLPESLIKIDPSMPVLPEIAKA